MKLNDLRKNLIDMARGGSFLIGSYVADGRQLSQEFSTRSVKLI